MEFLGVFLHVTKSKYGVACMVLCRNGNEGDVCTIVHPYGGIVWYCIALCGIILCCNGSDGLREMSVSYERLLSSVIPTTQEGR